MVEEAKKGEKDSQFNLSLPLVLSYGTAIYMQGTLSVCKGSYVIQREFISTGRHAGARNKREIILHVIWGVLSRLILVIRTKEYVVRH